MIAIGMVVCVFALPLKAVKGDIKSKLKKIDYGGSALTLAWAVLILLPLSWYVSDLSRPSIASLTNPIAGEELSTLGIPPALSRLWSLA
jgi:Na+/H+ antiporter NhaD/arsenite permease-like protein